MKAIDYEAFRKKSILAMANAILLRDFDAAKRIREFIEVLEKEEKIDAEPVKCARWEKRNYLAYCTNCNHSGGHRHIRIIVAIVGKRWKDASRMDDLIDREKLLHELCGMCCAGEKYKCRNPYGECYEATLIKRQATIEAEPMHDRWIPCSERLPEIDVDVIVFYPYWDDKPIQVAHLNYDKLTFELSDGEFNFPTVAVTHWMPLPEQPEREVQGNDKM